MIKKIPNVSLSYYKYFVEADDEEETVSVKVAPRKNRGTDYADDTTNIKVSPDETEGDATDYGTEDDAMDDTTPEEDTTDDTATDGPDTGDDGTDYGADDDGEETGAETEDGDAEGGPDTGDDGEATDYSADGDTEGDSETTDDTGNTTDDVDKRKKYNIYKRYLNIYEMTNNFLEKLRSIVTSNPVDNSVIKVVINNFNDLRDNMYDYMTIRFKDESYVQILIYFETIISIIKLNFELLRNNHINLKH